MPDIPNRVCRMRHFSDLTHCLALSAEMRGDGYEAARLTLNAMWLDARSDQLAHRITAHEGEVA